MDNIGLHLRESLEELINPANAKVNTWARVLFMHDNDELFKTSTKNNSYGVYVDNGVLFINGEPVAKDSSVTSDTPHFGLVCKDGNVYFGKAKLTIGTNEVINITKEDYSTLLSGNLVDGYTAFRPDNVYNIVDNIPGSAVAFDRDAFCSKFGLTKVQYLIYNNVVGLPYEHDFTDNHFLSTDSPSLSVHDYDFRIVKGDRLKFMVMVDTKQLDKLLNNRIDDTFTVIVKDKLGHQLFKRTVYAGEVYVELDSFTDTNGNPFVGETWFSVECINSVGCGSPVRYYDLLILETDKEVTYTVPIEKLSDASIVGDTPIIANNRNETIAYNNKLGFTKLFDYYSKQTLNGKRITKIILPKRTYYINYHKKVNDSSGRPFGGFDFWLCDVHAGQVTRTAIKRGANIPYVDVVTSALKYEVVGDPVEFIKNDGAHIHRVKPSQVNKTFAGVEFPTFRGDTPKVLGSSDINKIWVRWRNGLFHNGPTDPMYETANEDTNDDLHLSLMNAYYPNRMVYFSDNDKVSPLRVYNSLPRDKDTNALIDGHYYLVERTSKDGDNIEFPDNFTVDFNGSTLKAIRCNDANNRDLHYFDLNRGRIIQLEENYNTHIKNLKVEGIFYEFDFAGTQLILGRTGGGICEAVNNIDTSGSRFCSYENVESAYALCYDSKNLSRTAASRSNPSNAIPVGCNGMFAKLGYIGFDGNVVEHTEPIRTVVGSRYGNAENLVYDETYRACIVTQTCARKKDSEGNPYRFTADDFTLIGTSGYPSGNGKHYEMFVAFYNIPAANINTNHRLISTNNITFKGVIKTRQFYRIKPPTGATHYRVVGYGLSKIENGVRVSSMIYSYKYDKEFAEEIDGKSRTHTNAAFPAIDLHDWTYSEHSKGILYKNCYWHDSRSSAFSVETAKGVTFDGCMCERIAYLPYGDWQITKILSAFEDGGYKTSMVTIKNCTFLHTKADYQLTSAIHSPSNKLRYDEVSLLPLRCRDFSLVNNKGLIVATSSAVYDGYIVDNEFEQFEVRRGQPVPYRHMIYRNNSVCRRFIKNYYVPGTYYDPDTIDNAIDDDNSNDSVNTIVGYSDPDNPEKNGYRVFNCDDVPSYLVVMQNHFTMKEVDGTRQNSDASYDYVYFRSKVEAKTYK